MTGNPSIDKILLLLNGVVVGGACALILYSHLVIKPPPLSENAAFGSMIENSMNEMQKATVSLDEIVVNLYSRERRLRFLNTKMDIELYYEADRDNILSYKSKIFDALIDIAGNMRPNELNSVTGRLLLEERIKKHVNTLSSRPLIKRIYFPKYIIQ